MASRKRSFSNDADVHGLYKELDEASCAICMDHPHNAVLLLCSSHDKGCRSYICDTSYRHSNCLDRFRKLRDENASPSLNLVNQNDTVNASNGNSRSSGDQDDGDQQRHDVVVLNSVASGTAVGDSNPSVEVNSTENLPDPLSNLRCPLCRGGVFGWKVVEEARRYLDLKSRCCSRESCSFVGNYRELRRHARRIHPTARPADVDPLRQRAWRRLEDQREYDDIVSAIRSAMPGAVVLGDYVIENGDRFAGERDRGGGDNSRWLSTFFWFQMIGSVEPGSEQRGGRSRALSRHRRSTDVYSRRRYLWGENLLGLQDEDNDDDDDDEEDDENEPELNVLSDIGEDDVLNSRRRRRLTRSRADSDRQ